MRENAQTKGRRYVTDGRLRVVYIHPGSPRVRATCRGDGMTYELGFNPMGDWFCGCPAKTAECSHLIALRLVCEPSMDGPF